MQGLDALLTFLSANSNAFFLVAVLAMFASYAVRNKGLRAIRAVAIVSLASSFPLFVLNGIVALRWPDMMSVVSAGLWGWISWSAFTTLRRTRSRTPEPNSRWH